MFMNISYRHIEVVIYESHLITQNRKCELPSMLPCQVCQSYL